MASGYPLFGSKLSYVDYIVAHEFVDDITSATRDSSCRLTMDISRQTREVIASNEALARENIRATEIAAGQITNAMQQGFGELSGVMNDGFTKISYEMQAVSAGIQELNATFHWGFSHMLASMGHMNDSLQELIRIAKTPAQTAAYNHYEIASDAFRQGLYTECLESLDRATNGDQASPGYKLEWRFHQMKGTAHLPSVGMDTELVDLAKAEESFLLAARYAKADYPNHAGQAFLSAGWAAYCQGKMQEALAHTEKALAISPNLGEALFQTAKVKMALGEVDAALPILGRLIDMDRFYVLKAAGDGDFQRHDGKLREFLDALRKEKYQQTIPKVRTALEEIQRILKICPGGKANKAGEQLEAFIAKGANLPLLDLLAILKDLNAIVTEAKQLPLTITIEIPHTVEEFYQEIETYEKEVVVKPAGWFSKQVTEMQTETRSVTKKRNVTRRKSLKMDLCSISAGEFIMGNEDFGPTYTVKITSGFFYGIFPVTQAQWEAVMGSNPSSFKRDDLPVEQVSWDDCQEFIKRLNAIGKGTFRLPTEAEWEYACRAGSSEAYCFGDNEKQLVDYAWYSDNSNRQPQPVGKKKPNAWGLYDIHGNVWEWCQDWYGNYSSAMTLDPQGPTSGSNRVCRGGSWYHSASSATSAHRNKNVPTVRVSYMGFRIVYLPLE